MRHGISAYISLGQIREIPVYTADRVLMNRVGDERIRHISPTEGFDGLSSIL